MGIDAGFDMIPRLTRGAVDKNDWSSFIRQVREYYEKDQRVDVRPNYLLFTTGEHPMLPFEGHKFLRFSSKISGSHAASTNTNSYIRTVTRIATAHFGSRVRPWDESVDQNGHYSWTEVHETIGSYEQPDEDGPPMSVAEFVFDTNPVEELDSTLYETRSIPGKGRGLVARFNIPQGSRILVETPLIVARNMPPESLEPIIAAKLKLLSRAKQRQFLSLHNFPGRYPFSGTVKTNACPCGSESDIGGVYATASLINHSCLPNAHNNWNTDDGRETIHAIQPISSGEEITICYSKDGPSTDRRSELKQAFGFECDCSTCSLPLVELQASDARRLQIQQLDGAIGNPVRMMHNPMASIADCKSLLNLLEMEHSRSGSALFARLYYDAFQISIAHGDQARAAVFAKRAYEVRALCEGEDSPLTRKMKDLIRTPANHSSFAAYSSRWKSKRDAMPKDVKSAEYDKWLWRATE